MGNVIRWSQIGGGERKVLGFTFHPGDLFTGGELPHHHDYLVWWTRGR